MSPPRVLRMRKEPVARNLLANRANPTEGFHNIGEAR